MRPYALAAGLQWGAKNDRARRPHQALGGHAPTPCLMESVGDVVSVPVIGGLHDRYSRAA